MTHPSDDEVQPSDETPQYNEQASARTPSASDGKIDASPKEIAAEEQPGPEDAEGYRRANAVQPDPPSGSSRD
jgi:hypothetical protein